jgi:hypothetical protein
MRARDIGVSQLRVGLVVVRSELLQLGIGNRDESDGRVDERSAASSGIYFARIEFGNENRAYKLVLLK